MPFPLGLSLLYALAGGLWILFSDQIARSLISDPDMLTLVQTYKGWAFVLGSAAVLFFALRKEIKSRAAAEEKYKDTIENAVDGVFQSTIEGRYSAVNPAMAALYGYDSPEEMIGSIKDIASQIYVSLEIHSQFIETLLKNGEVERFEAQNYRKDGGTIWTSTSARAVRGAKGRILYFEGFVQNITQSKSAEQALRESEWGFRGLYQNNPLMLFTLDERGNILAVNQTATDRLGYTAEELFGKPLASLISEADREIFFNYFRESLGRSERILHVELRQTSRDGSSLWVEATLRAIKDSQGGENIFVVCQDISERKKAEFDLHLTEARYRALVEQMPAAVYTELLDELGTKVYIGPQIQTLTGYSTREWTENPKLWLEIIHPQDRPAVIHENNLTNETLAPYHVEYRIIARDGSVKWLREEATVIRDETGKPIHWQGVIVDISEQRRVEESIRQSEERFSMVFQASPIAICITSWEDGRYVDANPAYLKLDGYELEELVGRSVFEFGFFSPEQRAEFLKRMEREKSIKGDEDIFITKSGEVFDVLALYETIVLNGQRCILSMFHNITEQKHTQRDLARSEAILNAIAFAADQFLKSASWTDNIQPILEKLGAAAQASRVYIIQKQPSSPNEIIVSQIFEWSAPGISSQADNPRLQKYSMKKDGLIEWAQKLASGQPAYGITRELNPRQQIELNAEQILSLVNVPIMIEQNWWGFIGLDDCVNEHVWGENEIEALQTASNILSAAIQRDAASAAQQKQLNELIMLHAVAIANSSAMDIDELIVRITDIIGNALHPDSYGVLLLTEDKLELTPHDSYHGSILYESKKALALERGVTGKAVLQGKLIRLGDVRTAPEYVEALSGVRSELCAPIFSGGQVIGAVNLESLQEDAYNEDDERLISTIASGLGTTIEKLKLFESERRRAQEAENLREATTALTKTLDLPTLLEKILDLLPAFAKFDSASIILDNNGVYEIATGRGLPNGLVGRRFDHINHLYSRTASHDPIIFEDAQSVELFEKIEGTEYIHGWMGVPMIANDKVIGFLNLDSRERGAYTEQQATYVRTFANQAAIAIQNARSFATEQTQRLREASMLELMRVAASTLDLNEVIETILDHLMKIIPSDFGTIQLVEGERLRILAARGVNPNAVRSGDTLLADDFPLPREISQLKHPIRIDHVDQDDRYRWLPGIDDIQSFLGIPIIYQEDAIGIATLESRLPNHFTDQDQELALGLANHAASAIANARLYELEQQRRQEAENLRISAAAITSSLNSAQVLDTILIALKQVVPYDSATIFLLEGGRVRITAAQGFPARSAVLNQTFPADNKLLEDIRAQGQPVILYDAQTDPRFEHWAAADNVSGWMGVPLTARGEIIGFITLDSHRSGAFSDNSAVLAQTFAYQAAIAMDNARLYEQTRLRLEELEVVGRISFALRTTQDPDQMLEYLMYEALNLLGTDSASIWLYDSSTNQLIEKISKGWLSEPDIRRIDPQTGIAGLVYRTGEPHIIEDFSADPYALSDFQKTYGAGQSGIAVPIHSANQVIGILLITMPLPRKIESHQIQLLTTLAEIAGSAIHRAQLYTQSEEQVQRLVALRDVDTAIASSFDLRVTLNILLEHLLTHLQVDAASAFSYKSDLRTLNRISSVGFRQNSKLQPSLPITNRLLGSVLLERKDVQVDDLGHEVNFYSKELIVEEKFVSYYAAPLISKGQVKGIIEVYARQPLRLNADWLEFFHTMTGQAAIAIDNSQLFDNLQRINQELSLAYDTTLEGWGKALELRDKETQGHTMRVTELTLKLARRLDVPEADLIHVRRGVLLHDIGKMAVPDHILKKTGPLTDDEWVEMRQHPKYAYDLLYPITYLRPALEIPYCHHERWDGKGYPRELKGEDIPLSARIFSIVDVWDALLNDRPYRKAWTKKQALEYIVNESATRFDPLVVQEFLYMIEEGDVEMG